MHIFGLPPVGIQSKQRQAVFKPPAKMDVATLPPTLLQDDVRFSAKKKKTASKTKSKAKSAKKPSVKRAKATKAKKTTAKKQKQPFNVEQAIQDALLEQGFYTRQQVTVKVPPKKKGAKPTTKTEWQYTPQGQWNLSALQKQLKTKAKGKSKAKQIATLVKKEVVARLLRDTQFARDSLDLDAMLAKQHDIRWNIVDAGDAESVAIESLYAMPLLTDIQERAALVLAKRGRVPKPKKKASPAGTAKKTSAKKPERKKVEVDERRLAEELLILSNRRLVCDVAKRYAWSGLSMTDLMQEGLGLTDPRYGLKGAIDKYDIEKFLGGKFSTYATWQVRSVIGKYVSEQRGQLRLPNHITEDMDNLKKFQDTFHALVDRSPTVPEMAVYMALVDAGKGANSLKDRSLRVKLDEAGTVDSHHLFRDVSSTDYAYVKALAKARVTQAIADRPKFYQTGVVKMPTKTTVAQLFHGWVNRIEDIRSLPLQPQSMDDADDTGSLASDQQAMRESLPDNRPKRLTAEEIIDQKPQLVAMRYFIDRFPDVRYKFCFVMRKELADNVTWTDEEIALILNDHLYQDDPIELAEATTAVDAIEQEALTKMGLSQDLATFYANPAEHTPLAMDRCNLAEQVVLRLRHGVINDQDYWTLKRLGDNAGEAPGGVLGCTKERVRQLEVKTQKGIESRMRRWVQHGQELGDLEAIELWALENVTPSRGYINLLNPVLAPPAVESTDDDDSAVSPSGEEAAAPPDDSAVVAEQKKQAV